MMSGLWQDLRYGARTMRKNPGFSSAAILTLALGIGANTAIFTWFNSTLITLLPGVRDPSSLAAVIPVSPTHGMVSLSYPDYRDYRDRNTTLVGLIAHTDSAMSLGNDGSPERVWAELVSGNFFDVLDVHAVHGRTFLPEEDQIPNSHPVVVLSHGLWQRRFAGDPSMVGRTITLNTHPFTVVGIAPADFHGAEPSLSYDLWIPMMMQERLISGERLEARGHGWLNTLARLRPGVTAERGQAELTVLARQLQQEHPNEGDRGSVSVFPLWKSPRGAMAIVGPVLFLLMAVVALVLLIACANVAHLLLARATGRRREIAIRLSLGAGRARLLRQLLTESVLLSACGGVAGLLVAWWSTGLLRLLVPGADLPIRLNLELDTRVLAFTAGLALLTGIGFGLVPALKASRADLVTPLKDESGSVGCGRQRAWLRDALVVGQIATSLLLLIVAGLFLRSVEKTRAVHPGFNARGVLLGSVDLFPNGYDAARGRAFYRDLLTRLRRTPGVESVSLAKRIPLGLKGTFSTSSIMVEGYQPRKDEHPWAYVNDVGPDYFHTMQIPLLQGREFTDLDNPERSSVAVINQTMADRYWPPGGALGKRFSFDGAEWYTVVGIARTTRIRALNEPPAAQAYRCLFQRYRSDITIHVRTAADPMIHLGTLTAALHAVDPTVPLFGVNTLEKHITLATFRQRLAGTLLTVLGALALTLASVGIYGVLAFAVGQRTREIGIRLALGARRGQVLGMVLRQAMAPVVAGLALGLAVSVGLTRLLRSLLFEISPGDPLTFAAVTAVLVLVAFGSCAAPARRATRIDPVVALRYE
jgi:macrolide transport system ATP-binding/permease protein